MGERAWHGARHRQALARPAEAAGRLVAIIGKLSQQPGGGFRLFGRAHVGADHVLGQGRLCGSAGGDFCATAHCKRFARRLGLSKRPENADKSAVRRVQARVACSGKQLAYSRNQGVPVSSASAFDSVSRNDRHHQCTSYSLITAICAWCRTRRSSTGICNARWIALAVPSMS
jgi:hypothetical protein